MAAAALAASAGAAPALAYDPGSALYEGRAIVTGTDLRERGPGIARAFRDVLAKASGDPAITAPADAAPPVVDFWYQDRMAGIPLHDEQGSRDRPYDLTVRFDPDQVARTLAASGRHVWAGPRPVLLVAITVRKDGQSFEMTADGHESERARETLMDAAARYAMQAALPPAREDREESAGPPPSIAGAVTLAGTLVWDDSTFGWTGSWEVPAAGGTRRWRIEGASLDEAFRSAIGGAMAALSSH
jgi:hypothetical protein